MNKYLDAMAKPFMPITPWLLRLGLGIAFIYHGIGKFPLPPKEWLPGLKAWALCIRKLLQVLLHWVR